MSNADMVADFHRALDVQIPDRPVVPALPTSELPETLLREAFDEAMAQFAVVRAELQAGQEISTDDLAPLAHELADLRYVTYGAFAAFGLPANEVFREVHSANLAKTAGPRRADGKQLTPPNWRPADVREVLARAARD